MTDEADATVEKKKRFFVFYFFTYQSSVLVVVVKWWILHRPQWYECALRICRNVSSSVLVYGCVCAQIDANTQDPYSTMNGNHLQSESNANERTKTEKRNNNNNINV